MNDDAPKLTSTKQVKHPQIHFCLVESPDNTTVYCGASDGLVHAIDFAADAPPCDAFSARVHRSYITGAAITGSTLVTGSYDQKLVWWSLDDRQPTRTVDAHEKWIRRVAVSPDGSQVASVADDMHCRLWDATSGELLHDLAGHEPRTPQYFPSMLFTCCFSNDGKLLASADKVGHVVIWETATGKQVGTVESPEHFTFDGVQRRHSIGGIRSLAFSPDDTRLAVGGVAHIHNVDGLGGKSLVHVFDWRTGERTHKFENEKHKGLVQSLCFLGDGGRLIAAGGSNNGFFLMMDLKSQEYLLAEKAPMHIHDTAISNDGKRLWATGHGNTGMWEIA